jgi:hypothetical protein
MVIFISTSGSTATTSLPEASASRQSRSRALGESRGGRCDEVGSQPQAVAPVLEVRAPAAGEPSDVERRAEPVAGAATGQHVEHVPRGVLVLPEHPVPVLAHDGDPVEDDGLAGADERTPPAAVECVRQVQVRVGGRCHGATI